MQTTSNILMIRPANFEFNEQTAINNSFQTTTLDDGTLPGKALQEFDQFVSVLTANGLDVTVVEDTAVPHTPDSIFPNNWISFHEDGTVCLYPMFALNRRAERKPHVINRIRDKFTVKQIQDFTHYEEDNLFLEGTGSLVLDREHLITYACLSPRTDEKLVIEFCNKLQYRPVVFHGVDNQNRPIYHTNVMMCVADKYVVICLDTIHNLEERENLVNAILKSGKEIIELNYEQIGHFAGNMLQVENKKGEKLLVMSQQAYKSLNIQQLQRLQSFNPIIYSDLRSIETAGGGSARCMMAEIFLPQLSTVKY